METYELADLTVTHGSATRAIAFERAKLMIVSEYGTRLWYVDIDGISDVDWLLALEASEDIGIGMKATTIGGRKLEGIGSLHANPRHKAAAIRGDGELSGYGQANGQAPSPGN